jgi:hypothetical protein
MTNNEEFNMSDEIVSGELRDGIIKAEAWAQAIVIKTPDEYSTAIKGVNRLKTIKANIIEFFRPSKEAAHTAWKSIVANEKTFTDKLDAAEKLAKTAILKYLEDEERKRIDEERRLQAEADEKARKERERLQAQAAKAAESGKTEKAEALIERAEMVTPVAVVIESKIKYAGQSVRNTWKAKIIDADAVPREWCVPDQKMLDAIAKSTNGLKKIAGVEFYEEKTLVNRK